MAETIEVNFWEKVCDNDFLLLAFHVGFSTLSYFVWGLIDILSIPTLG